MRVGVRRRWSSRWFFSPKGGGTASVGRYPYAKFLEEDEAVRNVVKKKISQGGIAGIDIERTSNSVRVTIRAARPGLVIGHGGKGIEELTREIERALRKLRQGKEGREKTKTGLSVNVEELKRSEASAAYIAQQIAWDFERRLPFRRTIKKYLDQALQYREVKGAKIRVAGRLDGAEIAREESLRSGPMPLQTLRADIDHGNATAFTSYGTVGVEVWLYRGEAVDESKEKNSKHQK